LAIGVEGGFDPDSAKKQFEYEDSYSIVVLPEFVSIPWPDPQLPEIVSSE
jgi:ubiquitin carboxyl-terminal hydrolase 5/13